MPTPIASEKDLRPGEIYEDVFYHPCLCLGIEEGMAWGISLIDGSFDRNVDLQMSDIRKLTLEEAWEWRTKGPNDVKVDDQYRWW